MTKPEDLVVGEPYVVAGRGEMLVAVGLTKRELIAAMAMQGLLSHYDTENLSEKFAPCAVAYADALLAELKKPEEVP